MEQSQSNLTLAVVGFLFDGEDVILGLRKKVSFGLGENLISGIGGKVGDIKGLENESLEDALIREFKEEVKIVPKEFKEMGKIKFIFPNKSKWNQLVHAYLITQWEGEVQETEVIKPLWFKADKLPFNQMWDDNKFWLPSLLEGRVFNAEFTYSGDNKKVGSLSILFKSSV